MPFDTVADDAGYVIRDNYKQVAWCASGDVADRIASALEDDENGVKVELAETKEQLDAEETRSVALETAGAELAVCLDDILPELRRGAKVTALQLEGLELALRAWEAVR